MSRDVLAEAIAMHEGRSLSVPTHEHLEVLLGTLEALLGHDDYQIMRELHQPIYRQVTFRMEAGQA